MANQIVGIVDEPNPKGCEDKLGIYRHAKALTEFITNSSTPITIGIQGEWGSGKTSLLNSIYHSLEQVRNSKEERIFKQIWINAWENSLLSTPEEALLKITNEIIKEMLRADKDMQFKESISKIASNVFKGALRVGATVTLGSKAGDVAEEFLGNNDNNIKKLRSELKKLSKEIKNRKENPFTKIIIYVDDLDRIEPKDAVSVLELLKNIFSIPNCVFVLAIDYQVVVKGLEHKFGKRTEENEWEFRAFFDKIIQLPFMMPMGQYNIGNYVSNLLEEIGFINEESDIQEEINQIISLTIGGNPRSLKRLVNSLALIKIFVQIDIDEIEGSNDEQKVVDYDDKTKILLLFGLVCLQVSFPKIHELLTQNPDFLNWDIDTAFEVTKLKEEKDKDQFDRDLKIAKNTKEFNEAWEEAIFRICYPFPRYRSRAVDISKFFSYLKLDLLKNFNRENLKYIISEVINDTAVTNVSSTDESQKVTLGKRYSLEIGQYSDDELKSLLTAYLCDQVNDDGKVKRRKAKLRSFFNILLRQDQNYHRDDIKEIIIRDDLWREHFDHDWGPRDYKIENGSTKTYEWYVGNYMSNISKDFTRPKNDHLRQILSFKSEANAYTAKSDPTSDGASAGAKKVNFYIVKDYRELICSILDKCAE